MPTLTGFAFGGSKPPTLQSQTFTSNGTFTVPDGVTDLWVDIVGGGGNGSPGGLDANGAGGHGGGGGMGKTEKISVTPGQNITVVVGAGGGNSSSFGSVTSLGGRNAVGNYSPSSWGPFSTEGIKDYLKLYSFTGGANDIWVSGPTPKTLIGAGSGGSGGGGGGYADIVRGRNGGSNGNDGGVNNPSTYYGGFPGSGNRCSVSGGGGGGGASGSPPPAGPVAGSGGSPGGGGGGGVRSNGGNGTANTGGGGGGGGGGTPLPTVVGTGGTGGSGYVKVWWVSQEILWHIGLNQTKTIQF